MESQENPRGTVPQQTTQPRLPSVLFTSSMNNKEDTFGGNGFKHFLSNDAT
jgi:hypothetical protein